MFKWLAIFLGLPFHRLEEKELEKLSVIIKFVRL